VLGQENQSRTARTGQDRTDGTRQPRKDSQKKTARKGLPGYGYRAALDSGIGIPELCCNFFALFFLPTPVLSFGFILMNAKA
jgi:hypothetical protein